MSVVSSRVSSISSILKTPGARSSLVGAQKKICFKLPKDLKSVLSNYENGHNRQQYQDLVCILRDSNVNDYELLELLNDLQDCVTMLDSKHRLLIEVLLSMNWPSRQPSIIKAFKKFIEDLMCLHICDSKLIMDKLVLQFRMIDKESLQWNNNICPEDFKKKITHINSLFKQFLKIIPMSSEILLQSLKSHYPHTSQGTLVVQQYLFALIQILEFAPYLRKDILCLMISKLVALDVSIPPSEIQQFEDENIDDDDEEEDNTMFQFDDSNVKQCNNSKVSTSTEMKHPAAHMLDVCMEHLLSYVYNCCHIEEELQIDSLKCIYNDLLYTFERVILPTYASHHVQFIMFYLCSFKPIVAEAFIRWLWQKVSNPNVAPVIRQSAVSYIASLSARATYVPINFILEVLATMCNWIHTYISSQDSLECANSDVRVHSVFYSVCQAMFYLLAFRNKDLDAKKNLLFLQDLNLSKIVTCKLNPLKVCQPAVVQNFAAVTRNYQLAYCYTVIERNSRSNLPVVYSMNRLSTKFDTFFPFDPYLLLSSGQRITPIYNNSQSAISNTPDAKNKSECDDDDFMDESFTNQYHNDVELQFSYSTSPGFIYT